MSVYAYGGKSKLTCDTIQRLFKMSIPKTYIKHLSIKHWYEAMFCSFQL